MTAEHASVRSIAEARGRALYVSRHDRTSKGTGPFRLFQFGTLVLPVSTFDAPKGMISGQAVSGLDDRVRVVEFDLSAGSGKVAQSPPIGEEQG